MTVILVSHSMEDVAKYVDRIIVMNKGEVLMDQIPKEVFKRYKELEEVGLAAPQVTYIMHALKDKECRFRQMQQRLKKQGLKFYMHCIDRRI